MRYFVLLFVAVSFTFILAACASTPEADRDFRDYGSLGVEDIYYLTPESGDKRIHAITNVPLSRGDGVAVPPWRIIAITGAPGDHSYWSPLYQNIGQEADLTIMRRPGYGPDDRKAVKDVDAQVGAVLPLLGRPHPGQKTLLIGQSYGAGVAMRVAGLYPDKIEALLLLSPFLLDPSTEEQLERLKFAKRMRFLIGSENRRALSELDFHPQIVAGAEAVAEQIDDPVVILHGTADVIAPPPNAERAQALMPPATCAEIVWVEDAWHYIANDPGGVVSDALRRAMEKSCP